jgi:hypothetical protein
MGIMRIDCNNRELDRSASLKLVGYNEDNEAEPASGERAKG